MKQSKRGKFRILYVETNEIKLLDIPRTLDELGYDVYKASFSIKAQDYEKEMCGQLTLAITNYKIQCVVSYDFIETIAQAAFESNVPYLAWIYDCPQKELYSCRAQYPSNYMFAFDKRQAQALREIGLKNVIHMPLAIQKNKVEKSVNISKGKRNAGYESDITLVGQLYKKKFTDVLLDVMEPKMAGQLQDNIDKYFMKWEEGVPFHGCMSPECGAYLGSLEGDHLVLKNYPYITEPFFFEASVLSRLLAYKERAFALNKLAEKYDVHFYTKDKDVSALSPKVKVKPPVMYDDLTEIYQKSRININITLHCIETGASQRIFDVMAAGGFMLSNYQEELAEMFVPGEEIVLFHNAEELEKLVEYYLTHDEERERIARNGQTRVLREYTYERKLEEAIDFIVDREKNRSMTYVRMQKEELQSIADSMLKQKTDAQYLELLGKMESVQYSAVLEKYSEFDLMRKMLAVWKTERHLRGESLLLGDVDSVEMAFQKYLRTKHSLWRIEQNLSAERCMEAAEYLSGETVRGYFIAWCVYTFLRDKEEVLTTLSQYWWQNNPSRALELLSYGLILMPGSVPLLLQRADYLMELNMWSEALSTLKQIETPSAEVREIITELENAYAEMEKQV